jgi:uncharacterized protein (DUF3084 family)
MTISERDRHHLHTLAAEVMDDRAAEALMGYLPPVGWADVTRTRDLDALDERMELRFDIVAQRFDAVDRRFDAVDRRFEVVDRRFDAMEQRFDAIDARFRAVDARLDAHDVRFGAIEARLDRIERLGQQTRTLVFSVAALNLSFGALALGLVRTVG